MMMGEGREEERRKEGSRENGGEVGKSKTTIDVEKTVRVALCM